ncbi:glycosyltransferase family 4 protein [Mycolicibacterium canariasense]|uniref:glycosyltransferase family 4 protein n=1 Tax=Mycolicibacterium canariasense TaxID=228230 RepID=UPI0010420410|nr:glycosyltransferase family 4 protein [Mycolicibacterium canariasense]MCV7207515.1 glycosyltransferase [Mycolicibacterium canariasense]
MTKVLLLSPFSPLVDHDHAAADYMAPMVRELGKLVDLHVYAPIDSAATQCSVVTGVTYHAASPVCRSTATAAGLYPYHFRESWSRRSTREVLRIVEQIEPDVVHIEYIQPAEAALAIRDIPVTITMHDLATRAYAQSIRAPWYTPRGAFNRVELTRYGFWERAAVRRAAHVFTLSDSDRQDVSHAAKSCSSARIGVSVDAPAWSRVERQTPVVLFAGAMWRPANALAAEYLAREVLPHIRRAHPDAVLRIVGARPRNTVRELGCLPGVDVVGSTDDYLGEFGRADVVLAPSMVEAGVLLKTLHSFAAGAPTVLNSRAARGLVGLDWGKEALVADEPEQMAAAVTQILSDPSLARAVGAAGRNFVVRNHSWNSYAQEYARVFGELTVKQATSRYCDEGKA